MLSCKPEPLCEWLKAACCKERFQYSGRVEKRHVYGKYCATTAAS